MRKPASREISSASVELWEAEMCLLHIQLIVTNVHLPNMHKIPPDVDFESSKSPAESESWNNPNLHCGAVFPTWQYCRYCRYSLVWWMQEIERTKRLSCFCPFRYRTTWWHEQACLRAIKKQVCHFEPNTSISDTIWTHTSDICPTDPISSSNRWSSIHRVTTLCNCWIVLFANSQYISTHFFARPSIS